MLRVAIAGFMQESNSFAPHLANRDEFRVYRGADISREFDGTNSEVGGFLEACTLRGWQPVPLFAAGATSGGLLNAKCFDSLLDELAGVARSEHFDALPLALHGAMSTEYHPSGDAEIVSRLHSELGANIPIVVTHDLHANVLPALLDNVDGLAGYRTYPHVDQKETGLCAAALLASRLSGRKSANWQLRIPLLLVPQASSTFEAPLLPLMEEMAAAFPNPHECCASLFFVQPWLDLSAVAGCITITDFTEDAQVPGKMAALAQRLWDLRRDFEVPWVDADDLVARVDSEAARPVLVSEAHDAPSGGAAGDHTGLLQCLLPHSERLKACLFLIDPEVAALAAAAGIGAIVEAQLGSKVDPRFSSAVPIRAKVRHLSDGEFTFRGPAYHGLRVSMGPTATLEIANISVVVGSRPVFVIDPELFRSQGVEPQEQQVVGVKSPTLFRAAYREISETVLHLDMPGPCRGKLELMPYRRINRPIYPLDEFIWNAGSPGAKLCGQLHASVR
ncbi:MAG: M81 family metallopeptidase [Bryobacteraceae bacterium]